MSAIVPEIVRAPHAGSSSGRLGRSLLCVAVLAVLEIVACSAAEPEPSAASDDTLAIEHRVRRDGARNRVGHIEPHGAEDSPDLYASHALGVRIHKPEDWVFLPRSALKADTEERVRELSTLWQTLGPHWDTPLVAMAPSLEPASAVEPRVSVFAQPARPDESARGMRMILSAPPDRLILGRMSSRSDLPDYEVIEPPRSLQVGGLEGATTRLRYRLEGPEAALVEERMWLARQGPVYWWIEQIGPAPLSESTDTIFASIVAGLEIDPE